MTKDQFFQNITVDKENCYCMFCDDNADFAITNNNVTPKIKYPMCIHCAELFKKKIDAGGKKYGMSHMVYETSNK